MTKPKNRKQAQALGLKTYFTGKPCKRGGIADRRLNGDCLCDACLEFTRLLKNKWSTKNPEKHKAWKEANPEKMKAYKQDWQEKNRVEQRARLNKWKKDNPEKVLADFHKRRASQINATPKWYGEFDAFVMQEAALLSRYRSAITNVKWHIDHMIPLQSKTASGFHCASNIQVIPEALNVRKRNTMTFTKPYEWVNAL
jgi:hypothetical protein